MNIYYNENLKKFIDFYYSTNVSKLPSRKYLCCELEISEGEFRTIIKYFIECNFLYNRGKGQEIFLTKRKFSKPIKIIDNGENITYIGNNYKIMFNKLELDIVAPNLKITDIRDLVYALFLFTIKYNVLISPYIYINEKWMWFKKECILPIDNSILFMCEFTQHKEYIKLTND